jgi:hypothetical protein
MPAPLLTRKRAVSGGRDYSPPPLPTLPLPRALWVLTSSPQSPRSQVASSLGPLLRLPAAALALPLAGPHHHQHDQPGSDHGPGHHGNGSGHHHGGPRPLPPLPSRLLLEVDLPRRVSFRAKGFRVGPLRVAAWHGGASDLPALRPAPCALRPAPCAPRPAPRAPRPAPRARAPRPAPRAPRPAPCALRPLRVFNPTLTCSWMWTCHGRWSPSCWPSAAREPPPRRRPATGHRRRPPPPTAANNGRAGARLGGPPGGRPRPLRGPPQAPLDPYPNPNPRP